MTEKTLMKSLEQVAEIAPDLPILFLLAMLVWKYGKTDPITITQEEFAACTEVFGLSGPHLSAFSKDDRWVVQLLKAEDARVVVEAMSEQAAPPVLQ